MKLIGDFFSLILFACLPERFHETVRYKLHQTKEVMTSNLALKIFWNVLFFPIVLPISLLIALLKTLLVWLMPGDSYGNMSYLIKEFGGDIVRNKTGMKLAVERTKLRFELFTKGAEKRTCFGNENPGITFYVIRPYYFLTPNELIFRNIANLLTQYYYALQKLSYAVENGFVPVVDWENYGKLPHAEDGPVNGTNNSWEYYWEQPSDYTLEEVYKSKNVILSTQNIGQYGYIPDCAMTPPFMEYAGDIAKRCPQYSRLFRFNDITQAYIEKRYNELFPKGERVLGVIVRGASYGRTGTPYHSHPKQTGIDDLLMAVKQYTEKWKIKYVFFVNEMEELVDKMREEFGERLIVLPRLRDHLDRPADGVTKNPLYADGQRYQTNLDYITEIALLSKCDSLIGSMSSGMRTAIMWNRGRYENVEVAENGLW